MSFSFVPLTPSSGFRRELSFTDFSWLPFVFKIFHTVGFQCLFSEFGMPIRVKSSDFGVHSCLFLHFPMHVSDAGFPCLKFLALIVRFESSQTSPTADRIRELL